MKKNKKKIIKIIDLLIIIIIIAISYLLINLFLIHQRTNEQTELAIANYNTDICKNQQYESEVSQEILTNQNINANDMIGYIYFPTSGVYSAIVQGDQEDDQIEAMKRGVAHDPNTAMPGDDVSNQNVVLAGHRDLMFSNLYNLKIGDGIVVNINDNVFLYEVTGSKIITPDQTEAVFFDSSKPVLTMYTCYPAQMYYPATKRYVVYAKQVDGFTEKCN